MSETKSDRPQHASTHYPDRLSRVVTGLHAVIVDLVMVE